LEPCVAGAAVRPDSVDTSSIGLAGVATALSRAFVAVGARNAIALVTRFARAGVGARGVGAGAVGDVAVVASTFIAAKVAGGAGAATGSITRIAGAGVRPRVVDTIGICLASGSQAALTSAFVTIRASARDHLVTSIASARVRTRASIRTDGVGGTGRGAAVVDLCGAVGSGPPGVAWAGVRPRVVDTSRIGRAAGSQAALTSAFVTIRASARVHVVTEVAITDVRADSVSTDRIGWTAESKAALICAFIAISARARDHLVTSIACARVRTRASVSTGGVGGTGAGAAVVDLRGARISGPPGVAIARVRTLAIPVCNAVAVAAIHA